MLDFYKDTQDKGIDFNPIEVDYVGSLNFEEFRSLVSISKFAEGKGISFNFFEDMILSKTEIAILKIECRMINPESKLEELAVVKLQDILNACEGNSLVAYCD